MEEVGLSYDSSMENTDLEISVLNSAGGHCIARDARTGRR